MGSALRLRGRLEPRTLERALNEIVRRHEALRTTFAEAGGRPMQRIAPRLEVPLPLVDLSALPEGAREPAAARATRASLAAPFDLEAGPLLRSSLVRLAPDHHLFLLDVHHIVSDGWSAGVMGRELLVLYEAFAAGRPSPLPPLPIQYGDFARRQREELRGEALEAQLAYWRGKLGGTLEPLELPTDRPRPPVQTFRGGTLWTEVPGEVAEALRRLAREEKGSLFMVLLAALQLLLARLSGQEDVVVGSPIAGRPRVETEELIGLFLNTLALRTGLAGDPTFRELLARVRETTLGAYAHQEVPFEALLAELRPERDLSRTPVFQVLLNMLSFPPPRGACRTAWRSRRPPPEPESKFDLTLYAAESGGDGPSRPGLQRRPVRRAADGGAAPAVPGGPGGAARDPGRRIGAFSLVTPEAAAVLPDPSRPQTAEWPRRRPPALPGARPPRTPAARPPPMPKASGPGGTSTPPAASWPGRLGARLRRAGRRLGPPGRPAGRRPARRAAGGRGLRRPRPRLSAGPPGRGGGPGRGRGPGWRCPAPRRCRRRWRRRSPASRRLRVGGPACRSIPRRPDADVHPDAPAWIAFTSGSTGEPKGIVGTHRPLSHFLAWHQETFGLGEGDRFSLLSGLAHDPLLRDLFTPLWVGGELRVPRRSGWASRGGSPGWLAAEGVTVAHLTPSMTRLLAMGERRSPWPLSAWSARGARSSPAATWSGCGDWPREPVW